ncbi:hypothetical protein FJZ28_03070 [Candidatus Peregrinibacteria bacterium]|nr:hypothetical protein [Candidatus Peregrinibacteria bacterium]
MSVTKLAVSFLTTGALCASFVPVGFARYTNDPTISAAQARCMELAGREKTRCLTVHRRNDRLRLQNVGDRIPQARTIRERRVIITNKPATNIRRIGTYDLERLRTHNRDGGNARRQVKSRADSARDACKGITDKGEQSLCIRDHWRQLSKGQTR